MRMTGGYDVPLAGRPSSRVEVPDDPPAFYLPLKSRRFHFSNILVSDGQCTAQGHVLARDEDNYAVPLLAPRAGVVRLGQVPGHIVLEDLRRQQEQPWEVRQDQPHIPHRNVRGALKRQKMLALGAWQFFCDAHSGLLPDPFGQASALIVSTLNLEPFTARGAIQLRRRLTHATRALEHLQGLMDDRPVFLVLPEIRSVFARGVLESLRGHTWLNLVEVPLRYPADNFALLARELGLPRSADGPVWGVRIEGLLAVDRALTYSRPSVRRLISLGGPGASKCLHVLIEPGYPLRELLAGRLKEGPMRVVRDGVLTGAACGAGYLGIDSECTGFTILPQCDRPGGWLAELGPGRSTISYGRSFLGHLRGKLVPQEMNDALHGRPQACISCGQCKRVCPAGIMPYLIHRHLRRGNAAAAARSRVDLCVSCGLCSYVCPAKIELMQQFVAARRAPAAAPPEVRP
ncbi:MAG: 4Fe-4S dicluster domain-containing protein [Planctomycetaceae bacterium]|nr:4Fe-4S dicluster domain-containing protein [Planctomycetaceae bacterium]